MGHAISCLLRWPPMCELRVQVGIAFDHDQHADALHVPHCECEGRRVHDRSEARMKPRFVVQSIFVTSRYARLAIAVFDDWITLHAVLDEILRTCALHPGMIVLSK